MSKKKKQFNAECANLLHYSTTDAAGSPLHMYLSGLFLLYINFAARFGETVSDNDLTAMYHLFALIEDYHQLLEREEKRPIDWVSEGRSLLWR